MRLKQSDTTLRTLIKLSEHVYKTQVDDKRKRYKIDVIGGRMTYRRGLTYDKSTKDWKQTSREMRIDILIRSDPKSYKKTDTIKVHKYPCTILFLDFLKGWDSPVKLRTGSNFKPRFPKKLVGSAGKITETKDPIEKEKIRKNKEKISETNKKIMEWNIKMGIQMQFFFDLQYVYKLNNLLFGPCWAKVPPHITNPKMIPFLDKHQYFIALKILPRLFKNPAIRKMFLNEERIS